MDNEGQARHGGLRGDPGAGPGLGGALVGLAGAAGTIPVGALIGGALGTASGVRPTLWIGFAGSWAAGFWVFFSLLRRMRDIPAPPPALEDDRAPG